MNPTNEQIVIAVGLITLIMFICGIHIVCISCCNTPSQSKTKTKTKTRSNTTINNEETYLL